MSPTAPHVQRCHVGLAMAPSVFQVGLQAILSEEGFAVRSFLTLDKASVASLPDVLVLEAPGNDWATALNRLEDAGLPPQRVLAVCHVDDAETAADMLALGVAGCITPDDAPEEMTERVRAAAEGNWRRARQHLFRIIEQASRPVHRAVPLSKREREVLHLLASGMSNARIAEELFLAHGTVRNVLSAVYRKIEVHSRSEAVLWVWKHGRGTDDRS